jgi:hypothetical protein
VQSRSVYGIILLNISKTTIPKKWIRNSIMFTHNKSFSELGEQRYASEREKKQQNSIYFQPVILFNFFSLKYNTIRTEKV